MWAFAVFQPLEVAVFQPPVLMVQFDRGRGFLLVAPGSVPRQASSSATWFAAWFAEHHHSLRLPVAQAVFVVARVHGKHANVASLRQA